MVSLFVIHILVTSTMMVGADGTAIALCKVEVNDQPAQLVQGDCIDVGFGVMEMLRKDFPDAPAHLVIDEEDFNRI